MERGQNVLVAAPTGSGKTVVAEHAVSLALKSGGKCFYTAPIKALSNQKYNDLCAVLGADQVGLLTGDRAINSGASVVVMTTEVLRNMVYAGSSTLDDLEWVVLDEVHFLADAYRGPVWEEVLIHTPGSVRFVCLSATVSNAEELGDWVTALRGPTHTVVEHRRPIELDPLLFVGDRTAEREHLLPLIVNGVTNPEGHRFDPEQQRPSSAQHRKPRARFYTPRRVETIERLTSESLLPVIYFIFSRKGCDEAVRQCFEAGVRVTQPEDRVRIRELVEARTASLSDADLDVLGYDLWLEGLEHGIAAHHAGMIPSFREAVEDCFVEGLVRVVFATETLALGINMPARTVVIERLSKFNGEGHEFLTPGQFTQLTGRAGRRGIDDQGSAVVLWSPFCTFAQVATLAASREFPLVSSFRPTYNMAANLIERYEEAPAMEVLTRSFAQFQTDRAVVLLSARVHNLELEIDEYRSAEASNSELVFDVAGYVEITDSIRQLKRDARGNRAAVDRALAALRPGDVLERGTRKGSKLFLVLSVSSRKGGVMRVRGVNPSGNSASVEAATVSGSLQPVAHIDLPVPYMPKDPNYRRQCAGLLKRLNPKRLNPARLPDRGQQGSGSERSEAAAIWGADPYLDALQAQQDHPLHDHPDRDQLMRVQFGLSKLQQEQQSLVQEIDRRGSGLVQRFGSVREVLERTGHSDGWALTPAGLRLRRIYHESDLLISLCLTEGIFDGLEDAELAALVSCATYEHRSSEPAPAPLLPSTELRKRFGLMQSTWKRLERLERGLKLPLSREPEAGFAASAWSWSAGQELDDILDDDLLGGDFVRNVRQLIDLLRQFGDVAPNPTTAKSARRAAESLSRGVVLASGEVS
ncbi:MAG: DEAD/DEAH box helicase [Actinobacteria bacterium]|nr:DEAD/DEAH box helicase [Actinomycetota bacterium]